MKKDVVIKEFLLIFIIILICFIFGIRICPFYYLFKIPCPGCGLTRSIVCLLKFDIISSIKYNFMGIILTILFIIYIIFLLLGKQVILKNFINKNKKILIIISIILVIIVEIVNINNSLLY